MLNRSQKRLNMKNYFLNPLFEPEKWVIQAIQSFNSGFKRFQFINTIKNEIRIGLYGPTQVGKTTFILTLLGVGTDKIKEVSTALRAGRPLGKSSTITTFIYKKSNNSDFKLIDLQRNEINSFSSLTELSECLVNIREEIEHNSNDNRDHSERIFELHISTDFITNAVLIESSRNIQLIDLPGFDTRDTKEKRYVERLLNEQLSSCDVIIILELYSQMVRLRNNSFKDFADWISNPGKYRIVLTRTFSDQSVLERIANGQIQSKHDLLNYTETNLNQDDGKEIPITNVYPVEFGDSYVQLVNTDVFKNSDIQGWLNDFYFSLANSLNASASLESQIKNIRSSKHQIIQREKNEIDLLKSEIAKSKNEYETTLHQLKKNDDRSHVFKSHIQKLATINDHVNDLSFIDLDLNERERLKKSISSPNEKLPENQQDPQSMSFAIDLFRKSLFLIRTTSNNDELKNKALKKVDEIEKSSEYKLSDVVLEHLIDLFDEFIQLKQNSAEELSFSNKHIPEKSYDTLQIEKPSFSTGRLRNLINSERKKYINQYHQTLLYYHDNLMVLHDDWRTYKIETDKIIRRRILKFNTLQQKMISKKGKLQNNEAQLNNKLQDLNNELLDIEDEWREDQDWLNTLDKQLIAAWLDEYNQLNSQLISKSTNELELWAIKNKLNLLFLQGQGLIKLEPTRD